jgi:hypothetical protein
MNLLMAKGGPDLTIDETTWSNMGFGRLALWRVRGTPSITKGGQNVLLFYFKRRYLLKWMPHLSGQTKKDRVPGFEQEGPFEVKPIVDHLKLLVVGNPQHPTDKHRQIFSKHL